jgi:hypothetical protein
MMDPIRNTDVVNVLILFIRHLVAMLRLQGVC